MPERRQSARDKVIYGGVAEIAEGGASRDCVVRNISENGAHLEFDNAVRLPKDSMRLTIARKGRSVLAKIIWWRDNFVGVAFNPEQSTNCPVPTSPSVCARAKRKSASCSAASRN